MVLSKSDNSQIRVDGSTGMLKLSAALLGRTSIFQFAVLRPALFRSVLFSSFLPCAPSEFGHDEVLLPLLFNVR